MATSTPYVGTYRMEDFPTITVPKQPSQPVGNTPPSADMGLADLTKWMQNQYALNQYNYGNYYQDQAKAAQDATSQALNNYMGSVQGLQGLYGNLTNQAQKGIDTTSAYNQWAMKQGQQGMDAYNKALSEMMALFGGLTSQAQQGINTTNTQNQWATNQAQQGMGEYNTSIQAMEQLYNQLMGQAQGAMGSLQNQGNTASGWLQSAMGTYNPQQIQQMIQTGQVPQATQDYLTQIRNLQMENLSGDLDKAYAIEQRRLQDNLGARGVLNSQTTANALAQMMKEKTDQLAKGANTYDTQLAQNLIEAPYRQLEAAIQNLGAQTGAATNLSNMANTLFGSQMQGLGSQAAWGAQIPQAVASKIGQAATVGDMSSQSLNALLQGLGSQATWGAQIPQAISQRIGQAATVGDMSNQGLASMLQGLGSQAAWGAQIPGLMGDAYQMAKGMYDIPASMYSTYSKQLNDLFKNIGDWSTELERARIQAEAAGGGDDDWLTGIGGIIGAIGGLF